MNVVAFDNLRRKGAERNLFRLGDAGVQFRHGDVRCPSDLAGLSHDLIVECSAEPSAQAGYGQSPEYLIATNLTGCFHCLELARQVKADFIFLSTSRVYPFDLVNQLAYTESDTRFVLAENQQAPGASGAGISERFSLDGPRSLYGMTKLAAELMTEEYADAYDLRVIINRFGLLTGPYQMAKSDQGVIALWTAAHAYRRPLSYIGFGGTGKQVRDFLHIDDFCDLLCDQVKHFERYAGKTFNVGGGLANSLSLRETTALCEEITGNTITIGSEPLNRKADVRIYLSDHRSVSAVNGWKPRRNAETTIGDIHRWLCSDQSIAPVLFPS